MGDRYEEREREKEKEKEGRERKRKKKKPNGEIIIRVLLNPNWWRKSIQIGHECSDSNPLGSIASDASITGTRLSIYRLSMIPMNHNCLSAGGKKMTPSDVARLTGVIDSQHLNIDHLIMADDYLHGRVGHPERLRWTCARRCVWWRRWCWWPCTWRWSWRWRRSSGRATARNRPPQRPPLPPVRLEPLPLPPPPPVRPEPLPLPPQPTAPRASLTPVNSKPDVYLIIANPNSNPCCHVYKNINSNSFYTYIFFVFKYNHISF